MGHKSLQDSPAFLSVQHLLDTSLLQLVLLHLLVRLHDLIVSFFGPSEILFDDPLLFHALSTLLVFAILVPKAVKKDVFNLASCVVFSNQMKIGLRFISRDFLHVIIRQNLYDGREMLTIFLRAKTVVQ